MRSSTIVAVPSGSAIVALTAPERLTVNVSFTSSSTSVLTGTANVFEVSPAAKVRPPLVAE